MDNPVPSRETGDAEGAAQPPRPQGPRADLAQPHASNTEFLDRGIHVLYVALGMPIVPVDGHRPARLLPLTAAEAFRRKTTTSILWP